MIGIDAQATAGGFPVPTIVGLDQPLDAGGHVAGRDDVHSTSWSQVVGIACCQTMQGRDPPPSAKQEPGTPGSPTALPVAASHF